jgi:hypothetical protein
MEFNDLIDFIDNRMKMSHIYQPLLLRILVEAGGTAIIRQLAHGFLAQDESQLRFYEKPDQTNAGAGSKKTRGHLKRWRACEAHPITGYNISINNGALAGQTMIHVHFHLIPRRNGDTGDHRGGVRGVIPGKRSY